VTRYSRLATPVGELVLSGGEELGGVWYDPHRGAPSVQSSWVRDDAAFTSAKAQLGEYFAGDRRSFNIAVAPSGTPFQQRVWAALRDIPFGETRTYAELALLLATSARAVGHANARNPVSIVVPCHRLVGASGLTGYAGGVDRKRWLIDFERSRV
jgi:methylated-DNA-[protein]-cysteine S-methyltransferase